jgi:hypothetical protein
MSFGGVSGAVHPEATRRSGSDSIRFATAAFLAFSIRQFGERHFCTSCEAGVEGAVRELPDTMRAKWGGWSASNQPQSLQEAASLASFPPLVKGGLGGWSASNQTQVFK